MTTRAKQFDFLLAGLRDPDTGLPLNGGLVYFYEVGTTTPKNVWTETAKTNAYTSYTLDSNGVAELYGDGNYKIIIKDSTTETEYTFTSIKNTSNEYIILKTSAVSVTVTPEYDAVLANTGSNDITINLDDVTTFTRPVTVKKSSASNTITIDPSGTQQIDGSSTYSMTADGEVVTLIPDVDGGAWAKSTHVATTLSGLTATVDEINTTCDGNTATAAEITLTCDGNTATAAEITLTCDGNTATAAEITLTCDGNTATAAEITAACDGIGVTIPRVGFKNIGVWNMDATDSVSIDLGITFAKFIGAHAMVLNDQGTDYFPIDMDPGGGYTQQGALTVTTTAGNAYATLLRKSAGTFDSTDFNDSSMNRGYIVFYYLT